MVERHLVPLVTLGVASYCAFQAYAWLIGAWQCVVNAMP
jgi:hypothetical protein